MRSIYTTAPSLDDIEAMATQALELLPEAFRTQIRCVPIQVLDFPDDNLVEELELESAFDLLGLYHGVSLAEKSTIDVSHGPDMIFLFRRPILDYWCDFDEDLFHVVRHVLIHEIGHHFGLDDDDMEAIEAAADLDTGNLD